MDFLICLSLQSSARSWISSCSPGLSASSKVFRAVAWISSLLMWSLVQWISSIWWAFSLMSRVNPARLCPGAVRECCV